MSEIVIVGGGGYAKSVISILKKINKYDIIGYTDIHNKRNILNIHYIGDDDSLIEVKNRYKNCSAVVGIGISKLSDIDKRKDIKKILETLGFEQPAIVSPTAIVNEDVTIGKGTIIFDGVIINSGTKIGECVSINTNSSIDHDCEIGDYVYVAPGVTISGGVVIGSKSFIGAGATVTNYKTIGDDCIVGAGALIINDCLKPGKYFGVPAKLVE